MKTRLIAGAIAVVLAATGTVLVLSYVRGADARAMSGLDTVQVLVADAPIAAGTSGADLAKLVERKQLPANAVLPNGITNLDQLSGNEALVALEPGEQLLTSKFGQPVVAEKKELVIPPEFQQVTVLLELQRALGGQIEAGDTVGMFLSIDEPDRTHLTAHKVLVTRVQRATTADAAQSETAPSDASASDTETSTPTTSTAAPPPTILTESLLITVATTAAISEKIVFTAEFGSIWLSDEPASAVEDPTQVVDGIVVFQ